MSLIQVGCSGFGTAQSKYYQSFKIVEVQHTFYEPPQIKTLERWRASAGNDFEFAIKAWQLITHEAKSPTFRRLKTELSNEQLLECGSFKLNDTTKLAWDKTLDCAHALGSRRVLLQTPPSFKPTAENIHNLNKFFSWAGTEKNLKIYFEPRGIWEGSEIKKICTEHKLSHAVDPFKADTVTPQDVYFRLHGGPGFRHNYDDAELKALLSKIDGAVPTCVFFNNLSMVANATRFQSIAAT